jgi:hypothetical protein
VAIALKSRILNLLEPQGRVQVCNGIALPLPLPLETEKKVRPEGAEFFYAKEQT